MNVDPRLAEACRRACGRLRRLAEESRRLLLRIEIDGRRWHGPAAGRAGAALDLRRAALRRAAWDLEEVEAGVRRMGAWAQARGG